MGPENGSKKAQNAGSLRHVPRHYSSRRGQTTVTKSITGERSAVKVARSVRWGPGEKGVAKPPRRLATRLSRKSGKCRQAAVGQSAASGNPWLRRLLVQAAYAAGRSKNTYLSAQYHRLASRRGAKKAALAVAHSILVIIYHILRDQSPYQDLGGNYFDERDRQAVQKRLVKRLERMGYQVELQPVAQAG